VQWSIKRFASALRWAAVVVAAHAAVYASPVELGMSELHEALAARGLNFHIETELNLDPPGAFRIVPLRAGVRVSGGDLRGLMYGLIAASEQIRDSGKIAAATGKPNLAVRGVRMTPAAADLIDPQYFATDRWRDFFRVLALGRFNRFTLVLPPAQVDVDRIRFLARTADDNGVDFELGLRPPLGSRALYAQLREWLDESSQLRSIEIQPGNEPLTFYQTVIFPAIRETGRRVTLDLHGAESRPELAQAALEMGIALRSDSGAGLGEGTSETHALLPAPDPAEDFEEVRKQIRAIISSGSAGFEIDAPATGPRPYPEFYFAWGRLGYDQEARERTSQ
jgi:hypothetical protein